MFVFFSDVASVQSPILDGFENDQDLILSNGVNLTLRCLGDFPMNWTFPVFLVSHASVAFSS